MSDQEQNAGSGAGSQAALAAAAGTTTGATVEGARLSNAQLRELKSAAQKLDPMFKVGKAGLSPGFVQSVEAALQHHELIKVKFDEFKQERKELSKELAAKTSSHLIMQVGHVVVIYRKRS